MSDVIFSIDPTQVNAENERGTFIANGVDYTKITDGTEITTRAFNKMTSSIPSPFARVFLYNGAFETLVKEEGGDKSGHNPNKGKAFYGRLDPTDGKLLPTLNHYVVADALDMLEFLFEYGSDPRLVIERWTTQNDLSALKSQVNPGLRRMEKTTTEKHNMLHGALSGQTEKGALGNTIYIFKWKYMVDGKELTKIIGGSSALTMFYTAPNWRTQKPQQFYGGAGNELFVKELSAAVPPVSLIERAKLFREYLYGLLDIFGNGSAFFKYIDLTRTNYETDEATQQPNHDISVYASNPAYSDMRDSNGDIVVIPFLPEKMHNGNPVSALKLHNKGALDPECEFVIKPTVEKLMPEYTQGGEEVDVNAKRPVVLSVHGIQNRENPHYWYESKLGRNNKELQCPVNPDYFDRKLPSVAGEVKYPNLRAEDFFEDKLVKVGFRLDREHFITSTTGHSQYLIPLKPTYFKFFRPQDIKNQLTITEGTDKSVKVTLIIPVKGGTVKLEKIYVNDKQCRREEIVMKDRFNLAIFPFYRLEGVDSKYNCYEVMLAHDGNAELAFYNNDINDLNDTELETKKRSRVNVSKVVTRTKDESPVTGITTTYYHLGASGENESGEGSFQFLQVRFSDGSHGLVVPDWSRGPSGFGDDEYIFCVDFGTANTHVSYARLNGVVREEHIYDLTYDKGDQMVCLNESGSFGTFTQFDLYCQREFVPAAIVKGGDVAFPIRTLMFEKDRKAVKDLFGDINIAFNMKEDQSFNINKNQESDKKNDKPKNWLKSDIKWDTDVNSKNRVGAFFTELMWIIKNKVVSLGGDVSFKFLFTFPQSMKDNLQTDFVRQWNSAREYVRAGDVSNNWNLNTCTTRGTNLVPFEGAAPWYRSLSDHGETEKFMNVDIGGGTFDVITVLPKPGSDGPVPAKAFSARFAASVLWGHGISKIKNRENGFLNYYLKTDEGKIFSDSDPGFMNYQKVSDSPSDVISYLFKHDKEAHFSDVIRNNAKLRSLVVLHFASIIYYIGRVFQGIEIDCPGCMRFTGMGSLYIGLITESREQLTNFVKAILRIATTGEDGKQYIDIPSDFKVEYDLDKYHPKKITAEGGVMMWNTTLPEADTPSLNSQAVVVYGFEGDDDDIVKLKETVVAQKKEAVMKRMEIFFTKVFSDSEIINILNSIGIEDLSHLRFEKLQNYLDKSFDDKQNEYKPKEQVESKEAVFFWPLVGGIHELGLEFGGK